MAAIQEAAVSLFVRKGISGTSMQDIAAEAGISTGAIYRYYPSKESLLQAVLVQGIEQSRTLFDEAVAATNSPLEALEAVGRVVWCGLEADGGRAHIILELEAILAAARPIKLGSELLRLARRRD
jgi:AcrR family transcriptional regulator